MRGMIDWTGCLPQVRSPACRIAEHQPAQAEQPRHFDRINTRALHTGHDGAWSIHCRSRIVAIPRQSRAVGSAPSCAQDRWLSILARSEATGARQMPGFQENGSLSRPAIAGLRARLEDMAAAGLGASHQRGMSWHGQIPDADRRRAEPPPTPLRFCTGDN